MSNAYDAMQMQKKNQPNYLGKNSLGVTGGKLSKVNNGEKKKRKCTWKKLGDQKGRRPLK